MISYRMLLLLGAFVVWFGLQSSDLIDGAPLTHGVTISLALPSALHGFRVRFPRVGCVCCCCCSGWVDEWKHRV